MLWQAWGLMRRFKQRPASYLERPFRSRALLRNRDEDRDGGEEQDTGSSRGGQPCAYNFVHFSGIFGV